VLAAAARVRHDDVPGLEVLGLSHFQAARAETAARRYRDTAAERIGWLDVSPAGTSHLLDRVTAYLSSAADRPISRLRLPTEGLLAPFTVRIFSAGVGIEAHQDVLAAESPGDPAAAAITHQFSVNVYLECPADGGELILDRFIGRRPQYSSLADGPVGIPDSELETELRLQPRSGSLVLTSSYRVHSVAPVGHGGRRITFSLFLAELPNDGTMYYWA
jgi:hypothetical protein